jgi:hypothetical protein
LLTGAVSRGARKLMNRSAGEPPRPPACDSRPVHEASLLPNGSATGGSKTQVFEPQQHGEHSFELAVEIDLVAAKPLQLVRVERLTERLLANQRPVGQFLLPVLEPWQHLAFEEPAQAFEVGGGWLFAFSKFVFRLISTWAEGPTAAG